MSSAGSKKKSGGPHRKPRADIYTVLLALALVALLLAIVCLYFEMDAYEFKIKGGPMVSFNGDSFNGDSFNGDSFNWPAVTADVDLSQSHRSGPGIGCPTLPPPTAVG